MNLAVNGIRQNLQNFAMEGLIDTPKIHILFFFSFSDLISESETERVEYNNSTQAV